MAVFALRICDRRYSWHCIYYDLVECLVSVGGMVSNDLVDRLVDLFERTGADLGKSISDLCGIAGGCCDLDALSPLSYPSKGADK